MMDYFKWKKSSSTCSCGWSGLNSTICYFETFEELFEFFCPECENKLGHQMYPTIDEIRRAARLGDQEAMRMAEDLSGD